VKTFLIIEEVRRHHLRKHNRQIVATPTVRAYCAVLQRIAPYSRHIRGIFALLHRTADTVS